MGPLASAWDDPARAWPATATVATTNCCNADCVPCVNRLARRAHRTMSLDDFRRVADKLKARGVRISAMYAFGEPLADPTLCQKYAYARRIDVLEPRVCLNTNGSLLTPKRWDEILEHTTGITLSFFATGAEFERLTRRLSWERCYQSALGFIRRRDAVRPSYPIAIGVNEVEGADPEAVRRAFAGCRVEFVTDCQIRYHGGRRLEGPAERRDRFGIVCDGHRGVLHVKQDLGAEFCCLDNLGDPDGPTPDGHETRFGHFLDDSWETLEAAFRTKWRTGSALCRRCDYWRAA